MRGGGGAIGGMHKINTICYSYATSRYVIKNNKMNKIISQSASSLSPYYSVSDGNSSSVSSLCPHLWHGSEHSITS